MVEAQAAVAGTAAQSIRIAVNGFEPVARAPLVAVEDGIPPGDVLDRAHRIALEKRRIHTHELLVVALGDLGRVHSKAINRYTMDGAFVSRIVGPHEVGRTFD